MDGEDVDGDGAITRSDGDQDVDKRTYINEISTSNGPRGSQERRDEVESITMRALRDEEGIYYGDDGVGSDCSCICIVSTKMKIIMGRTSG